MRESNLRLKGFHSDLADDSEIVGGTSVERNSGLLRYEKPVGAASDSVEPLGRTKRVKFDLRSSGELEDSEVRAGNTEVSKNSSNTMSNAVSENERIRKLTGVSKNKSNPAVTSVSKNSSNRESASVSENDSNRELTGVSENSRNRDKTQEMSIPSRTVTRFEGTDTDADIESTIDENLLLPPQQIQEDTASQQQRLNSSQKEGSETFVSYKWGRYEPVIDKIVEPAVVQEGKRVRTQRDVTNIGSLGNTYTATEMDNRKDDDGLISEQAQRCQ